jgi:hypothetical protein
VSVSTGGHPLPLVLRADGRVEPLGRPGTLLGILPDPVLFDDEARLAPGDALILYTDGVVEASPLDDALGPDQLAALLSSAAGQDAAGIAGTIRTAVLDVQNGLLRDDVAVVIARVAPTGPPVSRASGAGSDRHVKLLVITPEPVDADLLRATVGEAVDDAEVHVISPATNASALAFWVSDADEAIAEAEAAESATVDALRAEGVAATGDTGESETDVAIQDALATFRADRIVVFAHPEGDRDYREEDAAELERRFGIPVTRGVIGRTDERQD